MFNEETALALSSLQDIPLSLSFVAMFSQIFCFLPIANNWPFRNSKKDWVLVYTLLKLHLIKKITQPPEISLKNW